MSKAVPPQCEEGRQTWGTPSPAGPSAFFLRKETRSTTCRERLGAGPRTSGLGSERTHSLARLGAGGRRRGRGRELTVSSRACRERTRAPRPHPLLCTPSGRWWPSPAVHTRMFCRSVITSQDTRSFGRGTGPQEMAPRDSSPDPFPGKPCRNTQGSPGHGWDSSFFLP